MNSNVEWLGFEVLSLLLEAQSAGAVEYTDYICEEGQDSPNMAQSAGAVE